MVTGPTDVVEQLVDRWLSGDRDRARPLFDPECMFKPLRSDQVYQGLEAFDEFLNGLSPEDQAAEVTPLSFIGHGDRVVMLARVAFPRTGSERKYTEFQSVGWVFAVHAGRVVEVATHASWEAAREAAGLSADSKPDVERRRKEDRRLFMRARVLRRATA